MYVNYLESHILEDTEVYAAYPYTEAAGSTQCTALVPAAGADRGQLAITANGYYIMFTCTVQAYGTVDNGSGLRRLVRQSATGTYQMWDMATNYTWGRQPVMASDTGAFIYVAPWDSVIVGLNTTTAMIDPVTAGAINATALQVYNGALYAAVAAPAPGGVAQVGAGLPGANANATVTLLPGFGTGPQRAPRAFVFADAATLYVADTRVPTAQVYRWSFDGSVWREAAALAVSSAWTIFSLAGGWEDGSFILYAASRARSWTYNTSTDTPVLQAVALPSGL